MEEGRISQVLGDTVVLTLAWEIVRGCREAGSGEVPIRQLLAETSPGKTRISHKHRRWE